MSAVITCRACGTRHGKRYMCDPLYEIHQVMLNKADEFDMPITEFAKLPPSEPHLHHSLGGRLANAVLLRQFMVKGAVMDVEGIKRPVLIFTGKDFESNDLPQWTFPGSPHELRAARDLVDRMTEMAIRRAAEGG